MLKTEQHFIGIDLHKTIIQACILDGYGEVVEELRFHSSTLEEGLDVVAELSRWKESGRFCVEAVGMNRWFVNACRSSGLDVVVVDASKLNLRMLGKKTDRRDAYEIARRLFLGDIDRNATTYYPTDDEYAARKLLRTRHKLVSLRQQLVNQIRALLAAYRVPSPRGAVHSDSGLVALRSVALAHPDLDLCLSALLDSMEATQGSIHRLSQAIIERAKSERRAASLATLPQVGPQTAVTLLYELGDLSRFRNAKAVASYAGLVPRVSNSADKSHHGSITKRGNRELRFVLGEWAVRLLSFDDRVKAWARAKLKRMHRNKLRVALARRLLVGVYRMLTYGEVFCLDKCLGRA